MDMIRLVVCVMIRIPAKGLPQGAQLYMYILEQIENTINVCVGLLQQN